MIKKFLKELRESADIQYKIFTQGSCFRLYKILKLIYPEAKPYWSDTDGHCITKIDGKYYDIGGEVDEGYIKAKSYFKIPNHQLEGYGLLKYKRRGDCHSGVIVEKYI